MALFGLSSAKDKRPLAPMLRPQVGNGPLRRQLTPKKLGFRRLYLLLLVLEVIADIPFRLFPFFHCCDSNY